MKILRFERDRLGETSDFVEWAKRFMDENKGYFVKLDDALIERGKTEKECEPLRYHICRACYDAIHFQPLSIKRLRKERDAVVEIDPTSGRSPIKAIDELMNFCRSYPEAAEIIADYWLPEVCRVPPNLVRSLVGKAPVDLLKNNLEKMKWSFELYAQKSRQFSYYPVQYGPLVIPNKEKRSIRLPDDPAKDGLVFELALLIRCFLKGLPMGILDRPMELPKGTRLNEMNGLIAGLVAATFKSEVDVRNVATRLDYLKKKEAKWVGWDQYRE